MGLALLVLLGPTHRGLGVMNLSILGATSIAFGLISRRGSATEDGSSGPEALVASMACFIALGLLLLGIWSSGEQRFVFLGVSVVFAFALLAFLTLHLASGWSGQPSQARRAVIVAGYAVALTPVAILICAVVLLICAALVVLLTGRPLDLSWLI